MAVLKNKTQGSYTIVSQNIMRDKTLTLTERGLLLTLFSLPDNWNFTIAGLNQILPDGREKISHTLNNLISKGYVTRIQSRGSKGQFESTDLEVHETPIRSSNPPDKPRNDDEPQEISDISPFPENPYTVNRDTENPYPKIRHNIILIYLILIYLICIKCVRQTHSQIPNMMIWYLSSLRTALIIR